MQDSSLFKMKIRLLNKIKINTGLLYPNKGKNHNSFLLPKISGNLRFWVQPVSSALFLPPSDGFHRETLVGKSQKATHLLDTIITPTRKLTGIYSLPPLALVFRTVINE